MDRFTEAYITCALWSSHDNSDESGGEPMDANYSVDDIAPETLKAMEADCADFQEGCAELLAQAYAEPEWDAEKQRYNKPKYDAARAGHDFWLTRNRHGAGFWDRGLGAIGDRLTEMAHPYGGVDLYIGDDGKIYG